jgi:hypothetical protein
MKTKELEVNGTKYMVKEPTVGLLFPLMKLMETDPQAFQLELAKAVIHVNGKPIGDGLMEVGMSDYLKLINEVVGVSGLGDSSPNA